MKLVVFTIIAHLEYSQYNKEFFYFKLRCWDIRQYYYYFKQAEVFMVSVRCVDFSAENKVPKTKLIIKNSYTFYPVGPHKTTRCQHAMLPLEDFIGIL